MRCRGASVHVCIGDEVQCADEMQRCRGAGVQSRCRRWCRCRRRLCRCKVQSCGVEELKSCRCWCRCK